MDKIYKIRPENLTEIQAKYFEIGLYNYCTTTVESVGKTVDIICENYPGELTRWERIKSLISEIISVVRYGV